MLADDLPVPTNEDECAIDRALRSLIELRNADCHIDLRFSRSCADASHLRAGHFYGGGKVRSAGTPANLRRWREREQGIAG